MIRVLVNGAAGKMGRESVHALLKEGDMKIVACVDLQGGSLNFEESGHSGFGREFICHTDLAKAIVASEPDVMVDFTHPSAVEGNIRTALSYGVNCVIGTTGLSDDTLKLLEAVIPDGVCLFVAPNFAIGAVLMMQFAEQVARFMPHVEVTELHHDRKADAPSGTAIRTARMIAAARATAPATPGRETELIEGARGAVVDGIHVHSVRLPGLVAHQEVIFGGQGQTLVTVSF